MGRKNTQNFIEDRIGIKRRLCDLRQARGIPVFLEVADNAGNLLSLSQSIQYNGKKITIANSLSLINTRSLDVSYTFGDEKKTKTFTGLQEGPNTLDIAETDEDGSTVTERFQVTVDTIPPALILKDVTLKTTITQIGSSKGGHSKKGAKTVITTQAIVTYTVDGKETVRTFDLATGQASVTLEEKDPAGNASKLQVDVTQELHFTAPDAGALSINGGSQYTNDSKVVLNLSGRGMKEMSFSQDNANWTPFEAYSDRKSLLLSSGDGPKTVYARLMDAEGKISEALRADITLDTTAPLLAVLNSPPQEVPANQESLKIDYKEDGAPKSKLFSLVYGKNMLSLMAIDPAGNTSSLAFDVLRRSPPPPPAPEPKPTPQKKHRPHGTQR